MKNKSVIDTLKFTVNIVLALCTTTATSLNVIIGKLSRYLGGIDKLIILLSIFILFCHNIVIPLYRHVIEDADLDKVKPSIKFTTFWVMIIVGTLCFRYVASAGFIEELYEKYVTKNPDVSDAPTDKDDLGAAQKQPFGTDSPNIHIVQRGDTLYSLAKRYGTTVEKIVEGNIRKYPKMTRQYIVTGWELTIE